LSVAPIIELTGLTKRYGTHVGVAEVHLVVNAGEVFGFLGANGAGKTTTIRCLVGLLAPSAGTVRVFGLDPVADHAELARRIGYLPGELRLYPELTGAEHLRLLGDLQRMPTPRRGQVCERLALHADDLAKPVGAYSHGMKQKLGSVQALQHDPDLVIFDEPTEGLDPLVQETFFELVDEAKASGRTVFLSSHILPEVQRTCERVAIVRAGNLVAVEHVAALRAAQSRRVRLRFADDFDASRVALENRWAPSWSGAELHLLVEPQEVVAALRQLLNLPVEDVTVDEASLDEAFLRYYRTPEPSR
jgi:ABC-2 type transport system ATP-binding protein